MKAYQLALLSTFLLSASARLAITNPVKGTEWEFGKKNTVKWTHEEGDKGSLALNLIFANGVDPTLVNSAPIYSQTVDDVTKDSVEFDLTGIDKSKYPESASDYFLRFGDVGDPMGNFSHTFTIKGGTKSGSGSSGSGSSGSGSSGSGSSGSGSSGSGSSGSGSSGSGSSGSGSSGSGSSGSGSSGSGSSGSGSSGSGSTVGGGPSPTNAGNSTSSSTTPVISSIVKPTTSDATKITTSFISVALAIAAFLL